MIRKKILILIFGLIIFAGSYFFYNKDKYFFGEKNVTLGSHEFKVKLANTSKERAKGLGNKNNICYDCGMLFEFPEPGKYSFWMKDMRFPLDILWISGSRVVKLEKNIASDYKGILMSEVEADMVLEINAGKSDEFNIKVGDSIIVRDSWF